MRRILIIAGLAAGLVACQPAGTTDGDEPPGDASGPVDDPIAESDLPPPDAIPEEEEVPPEAAPPSTEEPVSPPMPSDPDNPTGGPPPTLPGGAL